MNKHFTTTNIRRVILKLARKYVLSIIRLTIMDYSSSETSFVHSIIHYKIGMVKSTAAKSPGASTPILSPTKIGSDKSFEQNLA